MLAPAPWKADLKGNVKERMRPNRVMETREASSEKDWKTITMYPEHMVGALQFGAH